MKFEELRARRARNERKPKYRDFTNINGTWQLGRKVDRVVVTIQYIMESLQKYRCDLVKCQILQKCDLNDRCTVRRFKLYTFYIYSLFFMIFSETSPELLENTRQSLECLSFSLQEQIALNPASTVFLLLSSTFAANTLVGMDLSTSALEIVFAASNLSFSPIQTTLVNQV